MKFGKLRTIVAAIAFLGLVVSIAFGVSAGTLCGFGWNEISALCPVGAILSMVSSRTLIPQAVLSIAVAALLALLLGRAFCGWVCPVTLWNKIKDFFEPVKKRRLRESETLSANQEIAKGEILKSQGHACSSCGACSGKRGKLDSRHAVLGGAVLTSVIFGFPVFCLVCPVGLSFAAVTLVVALFGFGDLNWSLAFVPFLLALEIVLLKKWCTRFCPISALISLVARFSKTGMPEIDNTKCLETSQGVACSRCATVCGYDVNIRHPEFGELPLHDCSRCMECVEACPTAAISVRLVNGKTDQFSVLSSSDES